MKNCSTITVREEEMVKMKSFREYLKESLEAKEEVKTFLLEDVVAKIRQLWPKSDLFQMLEISKLSPDYNPQSQNGKLFIQLGDNEKDADAAELLAIKSIKDVFDGDEETLKVFMKSSGVKIEKSIKIQKKSKTEQTQLYGITLSGPITSLATMYAIMVGKKSSTELLAATTKTIELVSGQPSQILDLAKFNLEDGFIQNLTVDGDISRSTRWLLNTSYRMISKDKKPAKDVITELKNAKVALLLKWFNGDLKKQLKGVNLDTIPTVDELKKIVDEADAKSNSIDALPQEEIDKSTLNKCAARRIDLFDAAKKFGATTYTDGKWMIAITKSFKQNSVFGRAKPKVIPGTNDIDPLLYRYDEPGMTQDQKNRRDGKNSEYLKDGIGYDDLWCETGWCTAGSFSQCDGHWDCSLKSDGHWKSYSSNGQYPLIVIMNLQTGQLYQYLRKVDSGRIDFLNERDQVDKEYSGGSGEPFLDWLIQSQPNSSLGKLIIQGEQVYYSEEYRKLLNIAEVDSDGFLIVRKPEDIKKFKSVFSRFSGIKIQSTSTRNWFNNDNNIGTLPIIDMASVLDASFMFYNARTSNLKFRNCHPKDMAGMFKNAKINKIEGLDTSNAYCINELFYGARVNKRDDQSYTAIKISPFTLNLKECASMDMAFFNSHVDQILLEDTDKITHAQNAFLYCPFLKTIPNMKFKKLQGSGIGSALLGPSIGFKDVNGNVIGDHSPEEIFAYSPKVANLPEFEKSMQELEDFYKKSEDISDFIDDRGYLVIKNQEMAENFARDFKKYPGIKIAMEDASGLFYNINQVLYIKSLDLSGVLNANSMFRDVTILHLGKIEGTDNLRDVQDMFKDATIQQLPDMICPNVSEYAGMLAVKTNDITPIPPSKIVLGKIGFSENTDWSSISENNFYRSSRQLSLLEKVFGNAYSAFQSNFPWEIRKVSESMNEALQEKYKLTLDENGWITVVSEDAARVLLMNKSILSKCQGLKLKPTDGTARGWFSRISDEHLVFPVVDLAEVTDAAGLFYYSTLKELKGFVNCENLVEVSRMFSNTKILTGSIDILNQCKKIKRAVAMFQSAIMPVAPQSCNLSELENGYNMFHYSSGACPQVISKETIKLPKLKNGCGMFMGSTITRIKELELPVCEDCQMMFKDNRHLVEIGTFSAPNAIYCKNMFYSCQVLKTVSELKLPNATDVSYLLAYSRKLKTVGKLDIHNANNICSIFRESEDLTCIMLPKWSTPSKIRASDYAFYKCAIGRKYGKNAEKLIAFLRSRVGQALGN